MSFTRRPLRSKIFNPGTVVIHLEVMTMKLGGLNLLQNLTSFTHRLLRRKVITVIIYLDMIMRFGGLLAIHHHFTLRRGNWDKQPSYLPSLFILLQMLFQLMYKGFCYVLDHQMRY